MCNLSVRASLARVINPDKERMGLTTCNIPFPAIEQSSFLYFSPWTQHGLALNDCWTSCMGLTLSGMQLLRRCV